MSFLLIPFDSFIGYSPGFPPPGKLEFLDVNALHLVLLGPFIFALSRVGSRWLADKYGGARATFRTFALMIVATLGVIYFLTNNEMGGAFWGFFGCFRALLFLTAPAMPPLPDDPGDYGQRNPAANTSATGRRPKQTGESGERHDNCVYQRHCRLRRLLYPQGLRYLYQYDWGPMAALWSFLIFYVICLFLTWYFYSYRHGMLYEIAHSKNKEQLGRERVSATVANITVPLTRR